MAPWRSGYAEANTACGSVRNHCLAERKRYAALSEQGSCKTVLPLWPVFLYNKTVMAPWRSGYAEVCKTLYTGSNPVGASTINTSACLGYLSGRVAELVYAVDLKSAGLTALRVRVPPRPPYIMSFRANGGSLYMVVLAGDLSIHKK